MIRNFQQKKKKGLTKVLYESFGARESMKLMKENAYTSNSIDIFQVFTTLE